MMLSIRLLGTPEIWQDERPAAVERRKSRALLYVVAAAGAPVQREALLALFWPDMERGAAQQVLRTSLHGLRRALGEGLVVERDRVGLAAGSWVDAPVFERSLKPLPADVIKLESILDLYRGEFLEGFGPVDSVEFEDWLEVERERYRRLAVRALAALSRAHEGLRDYPSALAALEKALSIDPLQEDLQRETIRLAYLGGDRAGAILRYDQLRRLLDEELGVPPMAETRALYEDILNDRLRPVDLPATQPGPFPKPGPARPSGPAALPFHRREAELQALREHMFAGRLVLVEGEPGVGKTRLVEQFLQEIEGLVITGAARETEQTFPYQPFIEGFNRLKQRVDWPQLLAELRAGLPALWLGEAARLLPELDPSRPGDRQGSQAEEWRLWEAIHQMLAMLTRTRPILVFIDDLQWADPSSLGLLGYLVRHGEDRVGYVATARPFQPRSATAGLVRTLIREDRLVRLPLERFSAEEVREMARRIDPSGGAELGEWLARQSEGNLYILAELVRIARRPDGTFDPEMLRAERVVPGTIYSLIEARLDRLSEPARRVLDAAVAIGRTFRFDVAARAAGISDEAALDGLDELLAAGLVQPDRPGEYHFDHNLTMEVAYRQVGEARHRRLHHQVGTAMEGLYRAGRLENLPGLLAFHYLEGQDPQRAAPFALQAGQRAVRLAAWREATAYFEQALQGLDGAARYPAWMSLGEALQRSGEMASASEAFDQASRLAAETGDRAGQDAALLSLAQSYLLQARYGESVDVARAVQEHGLAESAIEADIWWGTALSLEGADLDAAEFHLRRAAEALSGTTNLEKLAIVEFELGSVLAQRGNLEGAVARYRSALEAANRVDTPAGLERRGLALNNLAYHLLLLHDPTAGDYARAGLALAQEKGLIGLLPFLRSTLGEIALAGGEVEEAEAQFKAGLATARLIGAPERIAGLTANLGLAAQMRGDEPRARALLTEALGLSDEVGLRRLSAWARVWLAPLLPADEASERLSEARIIAKESGRQGLLEEIEKMAHGRDQVA